MISTIFVIDSSPAVRRMVEQISAPEGFEVIGFQDGPTALEAARKLSPALIVADYHLEQMTFSGFCKEVQKLNNLADTYIIALVGATDKLDDSHLRGLGVKAFLKKPFQSEDLLGLIKDLHPANLRDNDSPKKRRVWPPVSSSTDLEDELAASIPEDQPIEQDVPPVIPSPPLKAAVAAPDRPDSQPALAGAEEAVKALLGHLLRALSEQTEKRVAELLPQVAGKDLAAHVPKAVETETQRQLGAALTQERLAQTVRPLLAKELPETLVAALPSLEPMIRHSLCELAVPLIKENIDRMIHEQTGLLQAMVPRAIQARLEASDEQIREELRKASAAHIKPLVEDIIRAVASDHVRERVEQILPGIAEEQVKTEIKRLSEAA